MTAAIISANPRTTRTWLLLILITYFILGIVYSIKTPLFEVSDELWHYPMVRYIATNGALPIQDPANIGPWRQEGSQPPLYYLLAAALTAGIDTADFELVRRQNPHADIGIIPPDGNINMMVHRPELEAFPWQGTALAVHVVRLFSVALGMGTVFVTYQLAREVFPTSPTIQLGATALTAFLPMFLFISGSVNNDNLSNLLGNWLLLLIVRLVNSPHPPRWNTYVIIGIMTGTGLLAKLNIGFLIPLIVLALLLISLRRRDWRPLVLGGLISGLLTILIAGWWYWRNVALYGDPTGLNTFLAIVGRRLVPANLAQLWSERNSFTQAYWGFFGGVNLPLPELIYLIFNVIGAVGLLGFGVYVISRLWTAPIVGWPSLLIIIAWPLLTFVSFLRWTVETPASQGRLIFGALAAISLWLAIGWLWWLPKSLRPVLMIGISSFFLLVAATVPFLVIAPAYEPPPQLTTTSTPIVTFQADTGAIQLMNISIPAASEQVQPEDYVTFAVDWRIDVPFERDWSQFIHLVTPDGVIISQRDVYPGGGLLATSDLPAGSQWHNPLDVWVPPTAYAPMPLKINIGWYHLPTGKRLQLPDGSEFYTLGSVELLPRESPENIPNPVNINFGHQVELVGYRLSDLSPVVGDTIELTLYWRGLQPIADDYKVFANILDPQTLTKYAASDAMPAQWTAPTSTWEPGTLIEDTHTLAIAPDAPPGIYELELGLYKETATGLERLRIVTPDGGQANNFVYLSRVRILPIGEDNTP